MSLRIVLAEDFSLFSKAAGSGNWMRAEPVLASVDAKLTEFTFYATAESATVQYAIYDADTDTKVYGNDTGHLITASGVQTAQIPATDIVSGTNYFLCMDSTTEGAALFTSSSSFGTLEYRTHVGATWPASLGSMSTFSRVLCVEGWGYIPPSITSVDGDDAITGGQSDAVLYGDDLLDSGGAVSVYLANNADRDSATVEVLQTFKSQTDSTVTFDVVQGSLAAGTVYAFAVTGLGQQNAVGHAVTLTLSSGTTDTPLTGAYTVTGSDVTVQHARTVTPLTGAYIVAGLDVTVSKGKSDTPLTGAYVVTGSEVTVQHARTATPLTGAYVVAGSDVTVSKGKSDTPLTGVYTVTGSDVTVQHAHTATPLTGSYTVTGSDVTVQHAHTATPLTGSYTVTGSDVTVSGASVDTPLTGAYIVTGSAVDVQHSRTVTPLTGAYTLTGSDVLISTGKSDTPLTGAYTVTGSDVTVQHARTVTPLTGAYRVTGSDVTVLSGRTDTPLTGVYFVTGLDVTVQHARTVTPLTGAYTVTGSDVDAYAGEVTILSLFRAKFPQLAPLSNEVIQSALDEAGTEVDASTWGVWYDLGQFYFAAYLLANQHAGGLNLGSGPVKSRTYGDDTITFAAPQSAYFAGEYSTNWYGYRYDEIVEMHVGLEFVLAAGNPPRSIAGTDDDTAITPAQVRAKFPTFGGYTDAQIQPSIDEAVLELWESPWGDRYELGALYFTAYLLSECVGTGSDGQSGPVSGRKVGRVSVSFATPKSVGTGLHSSNIYGGRYDQLISTHIGHGAFVI